MIHNIRLQPLVSLKNNTLLGYEALSDFVSETQKYPSAIEILKMVVSAHSNINFSLFVNLNAEDIVNDDLCDEFLYVLNKFKISGSNIVLEVSENMNPEYLNKAKKAFLKLKDSEIKIALDDFGTQYSTLSFLNELPIDIVKIDQSFVQKAPKNSKTMTLLKHSIEVSHDIGCLVVAEGIETEGQLNAVINAGADFGQGFIFNYKNQTSKINPFIYLSESIENFISLPLTLQSSNLF